MPKIYPKIAPDLFAEQPLVLFERTPPAHFTKGDKKSSNLCLRGVAAGGKAYKKTFHLNFEETGNPAIAQLWGRARIKDLMKEMVNVETTAGVEAVTPDSFELSVIVAIYGICGSK